MISKLVMQKLTIAGKEYEYPDTTALVEKINELADAVNGILDYAPLEMAMKAEPDYVTTTYLTDGHTKEYYGQNGASVVTDPPLPAGYVITIRESETRAENVQPDAESRPVNVQDKFAEQRKWIGKLCRFRDNPACEWKYGILYRIYEDTDFPFWDTDCYEYAECEPVKSDDDIIYKGE